MEVEEEEEKNSFLDHHMERLAPPRWIQRLEKGFEIARYLLNRVERYLLKSSGKIQAKTHRK